MCPGEDPDGCEGYYPVESCPCCGARGHIMDLGDYVFEMSNGNSGQIERFMGEGEAIRFAETKWRLLTPRERMAYTDRSKGAVFRVCSDDGYVCCDWADDPDVCGTAYSRKGAWR